MDEALLIKRTRLFVLDMDGTIYLGKKLIEGADTFLERITGSGRDYLFYTNNSSTTASHYREKLLSLGIDAPVTKIMSSGDVMCDHLRRNCPDMPVYLMGTPELSGLFRENGIALCGEGEERPLDEAKAVVIAFDKTLTYERLNNACMLIRNGASFFATHPDINCPTEDGFIPDCGAILAAVKASTGREPEVISGKPYEATVTAIEARTGVRREEMTFVGDRLYTDIRTATDNGAMSVLVLSGEATTEDLKTSKIRPDVVFPSVRELGERLDNG